MAVLLAHWKAAHMDYALAERQALLRDLAHEWEARARISSVGTHHQPEKI